MTSMSDQEFAQTEALLRQRLAQLATYAPTAVNLPDEVPVVEANRPIGRGRRVGVIAAVTALIGAGGFTPTRSRASNAGVPQLRKRRCRHSVCR